MENVDYAECYEELANAIVLQAFKDYRKALFKLVQEPEEWKHRSSKKKLERFFHSIGYNRLRTNRNHFVELYRLLSLVFHN